MGKQKKPKRKKKGPRQRPDTDQPTIVVGRLIAKGTIWEPKRSDGGIEQVAQVLSANPSLYRGKSIEWLLYPDKRIEPVDPDPRDSIYVYPGSFGG